MGAPSDPGVERIGGSASVDVEMVRFIREEIKAAVHEEIIATTSAPPCYDSSSHLLADDGQTEDINTEALDISGYKKAQTPVDWLCGIAVALPLVAIILSMPALTISRVDRLCLSVLAFFLTMAMYGNLGIIAVSVSCATAQRHTTEQTCPEWYVLCYA
jgi:hypothetical protein